MPKDIDKVQLTITQAGNTLFNEEHEVGEGHLLMPADFRIGPIGNAQPVLVRAVGFKKNAARIERSATTPIPSSFSALLRLPLNYLCVGAAKEDGTSTCADDQTCKQGSCDTQVVLSPDLPRYQGPSAGAAGSGSQDSGDCFDVLACFSAATVVEVDSATCSFVIPSQVQTERLNVSLRLALGSDGICGGNACWVPLDAGVEGWTLDGNRVSLPPAACRARPSGSSFSVAFSKDCLAKTAVAPPCGNWSSHLTPLESPHTIVNGVSAPPAAIGDACAGPSNEACGACGMRRRSCTDGKWSAWGKCSDEGVCSIATAQSCGMAGMQFCGSTCKWGDCTGQTCTGPSTQACGNCGIQRRTCNNGEWTDWSMCTGQGACASGATQACGTGATQACVGGCQWGECGDQACAGAPSEACGNCGTRTRSCETRTGQWSVWGACSQEGVCVPNAVETCGSGNSGMRVCGGSCQWDTACTQQICEGAASQACGNCGIETRSCNTDTGMWSDWSLCLTAGVCTPNATKVCGANGTQACGATCQWDPACTGQTCIGASTQSCGNCGTQARTCNGSTGEWSTWGICTDEGLCKPDAIKTCGVGGTQTCGLNCQWNLDCTGQSCTGPSTQECGFCGTQMHTCNDASGQWSEWGVCAGSVVGGCLPLTTQKCGANDSGKQTCSATCRLGTCTGQSCGTQPAAQPCGMCGTQKYKCDSDNSGQWIADGCGGESGVCMPGTTQMCGPGNKGTQVCSSTCGWGGCSMMACSPNPPTGSCGNCGTGTPQYTCDTTTGTWMMTGCSGGGVCVPNATMPCGSGGTQVCSTSCTWGSCGGQSCGAMPTPAACGNCGTQTFSCDQSTGRWGVSGCNEPQGACQPGNTQRCGVNNSGTQTCSATCRWGTTCTGQDCGAQPAAPSCGMCGTEQFHCDRDNTGQWIDDGCGRESGVCVPRTTQMCGPGNNGTQVCSDTCGWGNCSTKACSPNPPTGTCGNCGTAEYTCDTSSGTWMQTGCTHEGECVPNATTSCGTNGMKTCNPTTCAWGNCSGQSCSPQMPTPAACGKCGKQTFTCDANFNWVVSGCDEPAGACDPNATPRACNGSGTQSCDSATCQWSICACGALQPDLCNNTCVNVMTDAANCGRCDNACQAPSVCQQGSCTPIQSDLGVGAH